MGLNRWLGCIENPHTGHEAVPPAAQSNVRARQRVMVIGAGPAGLQAAIAAASRGHTVTVHERAEAAGGQVRLAATVPSRAEFGDLIRNQLAECARLGVTITYGSDVDMAAVRAAAPDAVIVATGAVAERPYWAPADAGQVVDVRQVLDGSAAPAGRVLIVDEIGFHHATSVAELLADRDAQVEVVTPGMVVGQDLGITLDMENWCVRAAAKGIVQTTDCLVTAIAPGAVTLMHHPTGQTRQVAADWVVCAVPGAPAEQLYLDLKALGRPPVCRIGDCVAPRRAHAAVIEGQRAGETL
jgi:2,4-dienoyl-CoA reductase (NADPH2)